MCFGSAYSYILYCGSVPHTLTFKALIIKCDFLGEISETKFILQKLGKQDLLQDTGLRYHINIAPINE